MSKTRKKSSTYLQSPNFPYFRIHFDYTEDEQRKILSFFPKANGKIAIAEIKEQVVELISCLKFGKPRSIKRAEEDKKFLKLRKCLYSLDNVLDKFNNDPARIKFIGIYSRLTQLNFNNLIGGIRSAKLACDFILKSPGKPSVKDPDVYWTVGKLADIWKNYTGKEPTLHNIVYSPQESSSLQSQKPGGPFLNFLSAAIKLPIARLNKETQIYNKELKKRKDLKKNIYRKEVFLPASLPNIAKAIIRMRKNFMAKIPTCFS